ncbi:MAG: autotransporter-associated beta strand repeat-containing protein, partial [Verrucomicrobiota bacterium]
SITTTGGVLDLGGNSQTTLGTITFAGGVVQSGTLTATGTAFVAQTGTVSAVLAGTHGLVKDGAGALILSGGNTFTGGVTLQQGLLNLNASGTALGSPLGLGTLTINGGSLGNSSGATVALATNNIQLWNGDFSFAGSNDLNLGAGSVTLGRSLSITTVSGSLTIGGVIAGSGFALTKAGDSTLVLRANNTYDGGTNISEGLLLLSGGSDRLSNVASITASGGTLDLGGNSQATSGTITFVGGTIQNGTLISTGTAFVAQSGVANAVLAGTQGLVKNGSGTFSLRGANPFVGPVKISQGTVALFGGAALADTVALTIGTDGTLALNADETIATLSGSGLLSLGTYKLTTNSSESSVFSGALSGSGAVEKEGSGSLTFSGNSTDFTGVLRVLGGTAMLGAGSPLGNGTVEISNLGAISIISSGSLGAISGAGKVLLSGATLTISGSQNTTLSGVISGLGAFVKAGSGELTLNNSNTFSGGFTLSGGAVRLGNNAALGSGTIYLFGGTLSAADALSTRTISNPVIAAGSAELGDVTQSAALTLSGSVSLSGSVEWNVQSPVVISNGVTALGAFGLTKTGDSTLTLGGQSTYVGGTTIAAGSLVLSPGSGGLSTSGSITSTGGVFDLGGNRQATLGAITFAGGTVQNGTLIASGTAFIGQVGRVSAVLGGTQGLVKSSSATLTLIAANSYTGGTILNEGSLVLSGGSDRLSPSGAISLLGGVLDLGGNNQTTSGAITISGVQIQNGTLTNTGSAFDAQSGTVSAILAGTQGLTKTSGGVLTLLSANQYTGATSVGAGTLTITGNGSLSQSTALSVASGATLNYAPTNSGTLHVASLLLSSGAVLGLGWGDSIAASGAASASGSLTLGLSGAFVSGQAYTLFSGGAGSSLNAAHFTLTGTASYDYSLSFSAGEVRIIPTTPTEVLSAYWVGGRSSSSPKVWNAENWARDAAGSTLTARTPTALSTVFLSAQTAAATNQVGMTLGADTNIAGLVASSVSTMSLLADGYLLQVGTGGIAVNVGGGSLSLATAIDLAGDQTWTNRGAGQLMVSGSVGIGNNTLQLSGTSPLVVSGTLRGTGGLFANNTSTLTLSGANSYTGGTTVSAGSVLLLGGDNRLSTSGSITAAGGVVDLGGNRQSTTGAITISGGLVQNGTLTALASAFDVRGGSASAVLAGSQALVKTTAGSMTLSAANTYSGGTTLQAGLLNLNNGGNASSSAIGTGTLTISGGTLGNTSGSSVTLATQNTQVWNGDFAFAGTSDLNLGTGAVTLGNNRTVTVDTGTLTVGGLVSGGTFGITKAGPGTLVLAGGYSFSGPTQVTGGRLDIGSGVTIGTGTISLADDALLGFQLGADLTIPNKIIGGRVLTLNPLYNVFWDGGTTAQVDLIVPDGVNQTVNPGTLGWYVTVTVVEGGSLAPSTSGASSLTNKIVLSGTTSSGSEISLREDQSLTLTGTLSGNGTLAKSGAGVLTLSGTNTFTGGSEVRSGTLEILSSHALGDGSVDVGPGAILAVKAGSLGSSISISNTISGTGELLKSGSGTVVVTGSSNTFTGGTNIGAGTLEIRQSGALGSGLVSIGTSASLNVNVGANETVVLSNNISGDGYLIKESKGKLSVTSSGNKFLGTRLMDGVLDVSSATALGSKLALNGGTLSSSVDLNFSIPVTLGGTMNVSPGAGSVTEMSGGFSGNGVLTKTGAGVLKISGTLSVDSGVLEVVNATSGSGGLEKAGLGTLLWSGSGTVQGSAQVAAGTLQMSGDQILRDVTKLGGGKMEVLGNSKFLGVTTLQAGTIVVNRQSALAEVPLLVVGGKDSEGSFLDVTAISSGLVVGDNINQTLKGRGTILGSVSIEAQGYLAPGNSIGTLTMGTISFAPGSIYEAEYLVSGGTGTSDLLRAQAAAGGTGLATLTGGY